MPLGLTDDKFGSSIGLHEPMMTKTSVATWRH